MSCDHGISLNVVSGSQPREKNVRRHNGVEIRRIFRSSPASFCPFSFDHWTSFSTCGWREAPLAFSQAAALVHLLMRSWYVPRKIFALLLARKSNFLYFFFPFEILLVTLAVLIPKAEHHYFPTFSNSLFCTSRTVKYVLLTWVLKHERLLLSLWCWCRFCLQWHFYGILLLLFFLNWLTLDNTNFDPWMFG